MFARALSRRVLHRGIRPLGPYRSFKLKLDYKDVERRKKKLQERAVIEEELKSNTTGVWDLLQTNSKIFLMEPRLERIKKAKNFPKTLKGTNLLDQDQNLAELMKGKITLFTIAQNEMAHGVVSEWTTLFRERYLKEDHDKLNVVQVIVHHRWYLKFLKSLLHTAQKKRIPESQWNDFYAVYRTLDSDEIEALMPAANPFAGYVMLVDGAGKIRARGCGGLQRESGEYPILLDLTDELLRENEMQSKHSPKKNIRSPSKPFHNKTSQ